MITSDCQTAEIRSSRIHDRKQSRGHDHPCCAARDNPGERFGEHASVSNNIFPSEASLTQIDRDDWDETSQDDFKTYISKVLEGWSSLIINNLDALFDGKEESIERLGNLIADGTFIAGNGDGSGGGSSATDQDVLDLRRDVARTFFSLAIPEIWRMSGTHGFVIDSGLDCDDDENLSDYIKDEVRENAEVCHKGKRYYLADADGNPSHISHSGRFSLPPGLKKIAKDDNPYGGVTVRI